jgi:ABC-type Mn2+/Zn2+ transport system permease subunit
MANLVGTSAPHPSWSVVHDVHQLFHHPFMQHAFEAGTIVAVLAGVVGYFAVLRQSSFAAHAMSEIGFAGASGGAAVTLAVIAAVYRPSLFASLDEDGAEARGVPVRPCRSGSSWSSPLGSQPPSRWSASC